RLGGRARREGFVHVGCHQEAQGRSGPLSIMAASRAGSPTMSGMATLAAAQQVTIEEFERMRPAPDRRYELDQGGVLELTFPNPWHNLVIGELLDQLRTFVRRHKLGVVFPPDTGFIL